MKVNSMDEGIAQKEKDERGEYLDRNRSQGPGSEHPSKADRLTHQLSLENQMTVRRRCSRSRTFSIGIRGVRTRVI
jgi:hypothetical protein